MCVYRIWLEREKRVVECPRQARRCQPGLCESYSRDSTGNGKKKWKYGKTWRRRACLPKLRCTCPAPSKISSTTFLEIEQPISRSLALLTGGSRPACFRPMECIHSYWGTETQRPSGLAIEKSFFGYYILIFLYILLTWCVMWLFLALLPTQTSLTGNFSCFERVRTHALFIRSTIVILH